MHNLNPATTTTSLQNIERGNFFSKKLLVSDLNNQNRKQNVQKGSLFKIKSLSYCKNDEKYLYYKDLHK